MFSWLIKSVRTLSTRSAIGAHRFLPEGIGVSLDLLCFFKKTHDEKGWYKQLRIRANFEKKDSIWYQYFVYHYIKRWWVIQVFVCMIGVHLVAGSKVVYVGVSLDHMTPNTQFYRIKALPKRIPSSDRPRTLHQHLTLGQRGPFVVIQPSCCTNWNQASLQSECSH